MPTNANINTTYRSSEARDYLGLNTIIVALINLLNEDFFTVTNYKERFPFVLFLVIHFLFIVIIIAAIYPA